MLRQLAAPALAAAILTTTPAAGAVPAWTPPEAAFMRAYAIEQGHAVDIQGELIPNALDLYDWGRMAACESGGRWHITDRSGVFGGGLQIANAHAERMSVEEQIVLARSILDRQGPRAWPVCSRRIGWN